MIEKGKAKLDQIHKMGVCHGCSQEKRWNCMNFHWPSAPQQGPSQTMSPSEIYQTNHCRHAWCEVFWMPNVAFGRSPLMMLPQTLQLSCSSECHCICTGSKVFQNVMEQLFIGKSWAIVVDNILNWGHTRQEHDDHLRQVLNRTWAINLKLNHNKMQIQSHLCPLCWPPANS